jgi:hypothetical protein
LWAKGDTVLIEVNGPTLSAPIQITDPRIQEFNVWAGPGASAGNIEDAEGFIVEWRARVAQPPAGLQHYQVSFYAGCKTAPRAAGVAPGLSAAAILRNNPSCLGEKPRLAYVVSYDYDASSKRGFVYLPRYGEPWWEVNSQHIYRGNAIDGHWFLATDSWDRFVRPVIAAAQTKSH